MNTMQETNIRGRISRPARRWALATVVLAVLIVPLTACERPDAGGKGSAAVRAPGEATQIDFVEQRPGIKPYNTRFVVNADYMRIDDGPGSHDFILLDRKKRKIYRVDSQERQIMVVDTKPVKVTPPFDLKLSEKELGAMKGAPTVGGRQPMRYQFSAKGELCYDVVAVPGLMDDALKAMREFRQILADDSTITLNLIPADLQNACDLARNTFAPTRHLDHGFPIEEQRKDGYRRSLQTFDLHFKPKAGLFDLPKGYKTFSIQQFRQGQVSSTG